jgi:predicted SprT family Zn-dependent metalloprotease
LRPTKKDQPIDSYLTLEIAYEYFNETLFKGQLPPCLITMQRKNGANGYFSHERFAHHEAPDQLVDEIALNPANFEGWSTAEILSTLVHEMAHLWQYHHGNPGRRGYHNRQWAQKMWDIGLKPKSLDNAKADGTGQKVTHTIDPRGQFLESCEALMEEHGRTVLYRDVVGDAPRAKAKVASKTKYTCPGCQVNAWAKPGVNLVCGDCSEPMTAAAIDGDGDEP